jgi:putative membrane protein
MMANKMLEPSLKKNDKLAYILIGVFSVIVFVVVSLLHYLKQPEVELGFDKRILPLINAILNSTVTVLLIGAMVAVKQKKWALHRNMMMGAMVLSVLFLLCYIVYHLFAAETTYKGEAGMLRSIYYFILYTHIALAGLILPFILFTAYRGLTSEFPAHKKIAKYTWPLWLYVSVTGVLVYILISPYYT